MLQVTVSKFASEVDSRSSTTHIAYVSSDVQTTDLCTKTSWSIAKMYNAVFAYEKNISLRHGSVISPAALQTNEDGFE